MQANSELKSLISFSQYTTPALPAIQQRPVKIGVPGNGVSQSEELRRSVQKRAYFQELTRQSSDKQREEGVLTKSLHLDASSLPKYHKKYQIENYSSLCVNGNHLIGGALQRDELTLLQQKKAQQQREMKEFLHAQMQEKKQSQEKERRVKHSQELRIQQQEEPTTLDVQELSQLCQQLIKEQAQLKTVIKNQEQQIDGLKVDTPKKTTRDNILRTRSAHINQPPHYDRHNLDTAGKSAFIYPNSDGAFANTDDELDKFVNEFQSQMNTNRSIHTRMTFTSFESTRKHSRPVIAKGLPHGVFRVPFPSFHKS